MPEDVAPPSAPPKSGGGIKGFLSGKIAGVPTWVIIGVGGVGIGLILWRMQSGPKGVTVPVDTSTTGLAPGLQPGLGGAVPLGQGAGPSGGFSQPITTNEQWFTSAMQRLLADGFDPTAASEALNRYLSGRSLSTQQNALVQRALQLVGPTPYPPPLVQEPPTTTTPPVPQPSEFGLLDPYGAVQFNPSAGIGQAFGNIGAYTVQTGETIGLGQIAEKVYGPRLYRAWSGIWAANRTGYESYGVGGMYYDPNYPLAWLANIYIPWPPQEANRIGVFVAIPDWERNFPNNEGRADLASQQLFPPHSPGIAGI